MTPEEIGAYLRSEKCPDRRLFPYQVGRERSDLGAVVFYDLGRRITERAKPLKRGRWHWTYDPIAAFAKEHPCASEAGIRRSMQALEAAGLIYVEKSGKYNGKRYDRKHWYRLTDAGEKKWRVRLIRFSKAVATALGIPKAVILEHFRHELHAGEADYVEIDHTTVGMPYSSKTISRHLDQLVDCGLLERDVDAPLRYRLPQQQLVEDGPVTIDLKRLLPQMSAGQVALLVAPSGTGKTNLSTFITVQNAVAGRHVVYVSVEEPGSNAKNRMMAQEYGIRYRDLRRATPDIVEAVRAKQGEQLDRTNQLVRNLRILDLSNSRPTAMEIVAEINNLSTQYFFPDLVIIDQLEFTSAEDVLTTEPGSDSDADQDGCADEDSAVDEFDDARIDLPLAQSMVAAFRDQPFGTLVVHQVHGNPRPEFGVRDIVGGEKLATLFTPVVGIGRTDPEDEGTPVELRLFSLTRGVKFETVLTAEFDYVRFRLQ
jgi:hypothetical protein